MLVKPPKLLYKLGLSRLKGVHERYQTFDLKLQEYFGSAHKGLERRSMEEYLQHIMVVSVHVSYINKLSLFPYIYLIHSFLHVSTCVSSRIAII
jgi:hypothetical protein